jgi:hypothetical protein
MKDLKTISIILLSAILSVLCFYFLNKIAEIENTLKRQLEFTSEIQIKLEFFNLNFDLNTKMTGLKSPDITCTKRENEEIRFSSISNSKPVLIYKYSDLNCNTCYEEAIKELQDVFHDFPAAAKIICAYNMEKDFLVFKKVNKIKLDIFRINHNAFNWVAEDYNRPYYFVLHPDMNISNIYVPDKAFPEMNKAYLESIKRLLAE